MRNPYSTSSSWMFNAHYLIMTKAKIQCKTEITLKLGLKDPLMYPGPVIVSDLIEFSFHLGRKIVSVTLNVSDLSGFISVWWCYREDSISKFNLLFQNVSFLFIPTQK